MLRKRGNLASLVKMAGNSNKRSEGTMVHVVHTAPEVHSRYISSQRSLYTVVLTFISSLIKPLSKLARENNKKEHWKNLICPGRRAVADSAFFNREVASILRLPNQWGKPTKCSDLGIGT